jgi:hypothetical protein
MQIALIADTHLSARSPECVANWHAVRCAVGRLQLVRQWSTPTLCVLANHDVGDASGEVPLEASLLAAYVDLFGPDHWAS